MTMAENSDPKSVLNIIVTNEQRDVIRALFDWILEELNHGNNTESNFSAATYMLKTPYGYACTNKKPHRWRNG